MTLVKALEAIRSRRLKFTEEAITSYASAYNLKRQFAAHAGVFVIHLYDILTTNEHMPPKAFYDPDTFEFSDPYFQMAYWLDSMLHNCRGSLETLGHLINLVYDLGLKESDVTFAKALRRSSQSGHTGVARLLGDIREDAWFMMINELRNRSYHVVLSTFVPTVHVGGTVTRTFSIRFPIDPTKHNMTHNSPLEPFIALLGKPSSASMEIGEFARFIIARLEQYLAQVDELLVRDCDDISSDNPPRSNSAAPRLVIPWMKLDSWRNLFDVKDSAFGPIDDSEDLG